MSFFRSTTWHVLRDTSYFTAGSLWVAGLFFPEVELPALLVMGGSVADTVITLDIAHDFYVNYRKYLKDKKASRDTTMDLVALAFDCAMVTAGGTQVFSKFFGPLFKDMMSRVVPLVKDATSLTKALKSAGLNTEDLNFLKPSEILNKIKEGNVEEILEKLETIKNKVSEGKKELGQSIDAFCEKLKKVNESIKENEILNIIRRTAKRIVNYGKTGVKVGVGVAALSVGGKLVLSARSLTDEAAQAQVLMILTCVYRRLKKKGLQLTKNNVKNALQEALTQDLLRRSQGNNQKIYLFACLLNNDGSLSSVVDSDSVQSLIKLLKSNSGNGGLLDKLARKPPEELSKLATFKRIVSEQSKSSNLRSSLTNFLDKTSMGKTIWRSTFTAQVGPSTVAALALLGQVFVGRKLGSMITGRDTVPLLVKTGLGGVTVGEAVYLYHALFKDIQEDRSNVQYLTATKQWIYYAKKGAAALVVGATIDAAIAGGYVGARHLSIRLSDASTKAKDVFARVFSESREVLKIKVSWINEKLLRLEVWKDNKLLSTTFDVTKKAWSNFNCPDARRFFDKIMKEPIGAYAVGKILEMMCSSSKGRPLSVIRKVRQGNSNKVHGSRFKAR